MTSGADKTSGASSPAHNSSSRLKGEGAPEPYRILFVCLGNICRSPAAQGVMQSMLEERGLADRFYLDSAGLYGGHAGDQPDRRMRVHAFQRGYRLQHESRQVRPWDFDDFDLILAMDDSNYNALQRMAPTPEAAAKVKRMADYVTRYPNVDCVPDPYYEGAAGFEYVLDLLEDACANLIEAKGFSNY